MGRLFQLKMSLSVFAVVMAALPICTMAAGGGGGGGGGSSPSESAPLYDPAAEYAKGLAAIKAKDFNTAKRAFDRVIAVAPKDANTQFLAGYSRTNLNDWKGAKRYLEKAVKLDPKLIGAHQALGITYAKTGDRAKAEGIVAALKGRETTCATKCADAASLKEAITAITAALSGPTTSALAPDKSLLFASAAQGDELYLAAVSLINEGRYDDAIDQLKAAQASFGPHPDVLTYLGFANRKLGRFDVAESYYISALTAAPAHRGATEYYGELMVQRGDMAGAQVMLARLDAQCQFGCAEADELRRWVVAGHAPHS